MDKKYVITVRKIAHIVRDGGEKEGHVGIWGTVCGKRVNALLATDALPDGVRMCKHCKKHSDIQTP